MFYFGAALVLAKGHIADPVQAVFDAPVASIVSEQLLGCASLGREAGDRVGDLGRLLEFGLAPGFLLGGDSFDATDLLNARPVEMFG